MAKHIRVITVNEGTCACGCLEAVTKGARFRPGHDQRLKGMLIRSQRDGDKIQAVIDGDKRPLVSPEDYGKSVLSETGAFRLALHLHGEDESARVVVR